MAPRADSSGVGGTIPCAIVGEKQLGHGGLLIHVKNDRLNHLHDNQYFG
jgi:hypothetical protein